MDTPICISQYFVNKQNVRSFGNIIKWNILKNYSVKKFCILVLEDECLLSDLSNEFLNILSTLKINIKEKCKQEFKNYFPEDKEIMEDTKELYPVSKDYIIKNSWKALCEIIPRNFFGCNQNTKILMSLLQTVICSMKRQHIKVEKYMVKWDFLVPPWITLPDTSSKKILYNIIIWLFKYVVASIVCLNFYVTTCKLDPNENKLYYFWKHQWQSFYDKQISKMVFTKVIQKCVPYSSNKKSIKRNHSLADRRKLKVLQKDIPKLYLTLKPNYDSRPIVCYKNDSQSTLEKYKIRDRLRLIRLLTGRPQTKLENQYYTMHTKWLNANKPKLYFIKTDLSNAFGSINRQKLAKILSEKHTHFQKVEKCMFMKKKVATQYRDLVSELRKPILIRAGSTVYEWQEGLVQGYKYSPALSELYYTYLDELVFSELQKCNENQVKLFVRVVDDYLFITDSLKDAFLFLNALSNYRNVNYNKTVVNFPHESIKYNEEIFFLGYSYNTSTMQVSRASNIYAGLICYKIAFTRGLSDLHRFIESRIGQSGIQINSHIFNLHYNNEELIWSHIFTTFCLSANKFCTILAILSDEQTMKNFLVLYKKRVTVKMSNSMIEMLLKNKPSDFMFVYCINHFRYLSWKALYICAKLTPKCTGMVPFINNELAKTNCIFGKWQEHARRIDTNGECLHISVREVCRRNDLRKLFRDFDVLPKGFQCYHHKILM